MLILASLLGLMIAAVAVTGLARRLKTPAPALLAVGGAALGLLPHPPPIQLDPGIALALFVAPILLDAAFDTSLRDLRDNWRPVTALVLGAVGLTTALVALVAHDLAGLPWAAAVALGAIVAPPDAVAATAVLRAVNPPHRVMVILEGESLLNDASALLVYRIAVGAAVSGGGFHIATAAPLFLLTAAGSVLLGVATAWINVRLLSHVRAPGSTVLQFVTTIGLWLLADALHLSAVLTLVAFGITAARRAPQITSARDRVASYAVWDFAVFVLQVLAFVLIGLQLRPILGRLSGQQLITDLTVAGAVLATTILARTAWVMSYNTIVRVGYRLFGFHPRRPMMQATTRSGLVVSWSGMRGIVTLAAAYGLPAHFPGRDLILLCAFTVVIGTLLIQGVTLRPLLLWLKLKDDRVVEREVADGRQKALRAAIDALADETSPEAEAVRREYRDALAILGDGGGDTVHNALRRKAIAAARQTALDLRHNEMLGDDAFHVLEEELDRFELGAEARNEG